MSIEVAISGLGLAIRRLADAVDAVRLLACEDAPNREDPIVEDGLCDAACELSGEVAAMSEAALGEPAAAIAAVTRHWLRAERIFHEDLGASRREQLREAAQRRGGAWMAWLSSSEQALRETDEACRDIADKLSECWRELSESPPSRPDASPPLQYVQALYDRVISWYESAERKAQLILTLDGVFVSFLAATAFKGSSDLRGTTRTFGPETWALLSLMAACLFASIVSAVVALRSRLIPQRELMGQLTTRVTKPQKNGAYDPASTFFFQHLANLEPDTLAARLAATDVHLAVTTIAVNVVPLAKNVVSKHRWVNRGFFYAGAVLVFFLGAAISYVSRAS